MEYPLLADKEQAVQKMFSSIARYYDLNNTLLSLGLHHRWKRETVRLANLCPGEQVLDLGAGTADLALLAADCVGQNGTVIAADLNEPMLRIGQKKLMAFPQAVCVLANAEQLPITDGSIDAVLTGFCLRNVTDLDRALSEIARVLKPGGRMVCLEFSRPVHKWFRKIYDFYSFSLLPFVGTWVSKDPTGVYQYLPDSIRRFPDQEALVEKMKKAGFLQVSFINLTGGIVAIHIGKK
jgi:demethylmenaquinone methyltransferase/2-methoxy-6-polyprenyl-1,4-benzoquinol methylase